MAQRSWFCRTVGFWFVPVRVADLGPEEWGKIRRSSGFGKSRRARRVLVVLWIPLLAFWAHLALLHVGGDRMDSVNASLVVLITLFLVWVGFRAMRISLAQPSLEDRAVVDYGAEFAALKKKQRAELFQKQTREAIMGNVPQDEREADLRRRSEATAYRFLRPLLAVVIAAWWAVCLYGRFEDAVRGMLTRTAIAVTFLAVAVLVLPTMIRMWTQPDAPGEPKLVEAAPREA